MPIASHLIGIVLGLTSAAVWGGGDFTGGYAARKISPAVVLAVSALSGLAVLILAALAWRESFPSARGMLWAILGGASGALGIAAFYRALALGHSAIVSPLAGILGAALPVVVNGFFAGWPTPTQGVGFALALAGIWFVSRAPGAETRVSRLGVGLACLGGLGFGGFLLFLGLVDKGKVFTPLILARCMTLLVGLALMAAQRQRWPAPADSRVALLAGVLDAGGNLLYVLARQYTRLDVAAVLASLYPASTVCLSSLLLKEKISRSQWVGVGGCLAALALITAPS